MKEQLRNRRSIRVPAYDYADEGYFFVTICTKDRRRLFGRVVHGEMELNEMGRIAREELLRTPELRPNVRIDSCIVMPDHVHFILQITSKDAGAHDAGAHDAGAHDVGAHDVGAHDAGAHDVGAHDVGAHDAGAHDVGAHDAGAHDAGAHDAGAHDVGAHSCAPLQGTKHGHKKLFRKPRSLSSCIAQYKSTTTRLINRFQGIGGIKIWQRNFYERIIRDEEELSFYRIYIKENPWNWGRK